MLSKNNTQELDRQYLIAEGSQRFGLRKLSVGVASVLLGTTIGLGVAGQAHADTVANTGATNASATQTTASTAQAYSAPVQSTGNVTAASQTPVATQNVAPATDISTSTINAATNRQQAPQEQVASPNANSIQVQAPANNNAVYNNNVNYGVVNNSAGTTNVNNNAGRVNNYNVNRNVAAINAGQLYGQSLVQNTNASQVNNATNSNVGNQVQANNQISQLNVPTNDLKLDNNKLDERQKQTLNIVNATRDFNKSISLAAEDVYNNANDGDDSSTANSYNWKADGADASTTHDNDAQHSPENNVNSIVTVKFVDDQGNELKAPVEIQTDYVRPKHSDSGTFNDWQVIGLPHLIQGSGLDLSQDAIQMHLDASQTRIPFGQHQGDPCQTFSYTIDSPIVDGYYIYSTAGEDGSGQAEPIYSNTTNETDQMSASYSDFLGTQYGKQPVLKATVVFTYKKSAPKTSTGMEEYIDKDNGNKVVKSNNLNGNIGSQVDVDFANPSNLPAGYEFVPGTNIPSTITIDGDPTKNDVQIPIQHKHVKVPHDQPQKDGTPTPDNPNVTFKHVGDNDLNYQATRTINDHVEEEGSSATQPKITKQVGNVHRDADVDEVTGDVTYTDWTTDNDSWKAYSPDVVSGHVATPDQVPAATVTKDTKNTTIDIHYVANAVKGNINYIEKKTGKTLKSDPLTGKAGEDVPVNANDVPAGYELVPGQNIPKTVKAGADKIPDVNVYVQKAAVDGNVFYKDKDSGQIVKTDQLSGKPGEDVPVKKSIPDGYEEVPGQNIPASVKAGEDNIPDVTILVQKKTFKAPIKYIDPQGNLVKEDDNSLHGKFGDNLPVPVQIPEHWELVPGQNVPTTVPVTKDGIQPVTIMIRHKHVTYTSKTPADQLDYGVTHSDLEKDIVRIIRVHNPQTGMVDNNLQEVTFTREVTVDEVTQAKDWTNWNQNDGGWDQFKAPDFAGYQATPEQITAKTVNIDTPDESADIYYSPKQKEAPKDNGQQTPANQPQAGTVVTGAPEAATIESPAAPAMSVPMETVAEPAPSVAPSVMAASPVQQAALPQTGNSKDGEAMAMAGLATMAASLGLMMLGKRREM